MRPTYAQLLAKMIDDSGLTLRELSDRCVARGQSITYSYISKLRTGNLPPPSGDMTRALAGVMGKDAAPLLGLTLLDRLEADWIDLFGPVATGLGRKVS